MARTDFHASRGEAICRHKVSLPWRTGLAWGKTDSAGPRTSTLSPAWGEGASRWGAGTARRSASLARTRCQMLDASDLYSL